MLFVLLEFLPRTFLIGNHTAFGLLYLFKVDTYFLREFFLSLNGEFSRLVSGFDLSRPIFLM